MEANDIAGLIACSALMLLCIVVPILTFMYYIKELNFRKIRDLKAIEALKNNVELKLSTADIKNLMEGSV